MLVSHGVVSFHIRGSLRGHIHELSGCVPSSRPVCNKFGKFGLDDIDQSSSGIVLSSISSEALIIMSHAHSG